MITDQTIENAIKEEQMDKSITESNLLQAQETAKNRSLTEDLLTMNSEMLGQLFNE